MIGRPKFVLASGSPRRLALVNQAGIEPDALKPADLDETPLRGEIPRAYANRLARAKAETALANVKLEAAGKDFRVTTPRYQCTVAADGAIPTFTAEGQEFLDGAVCRGLYLYDTTTMAFGGVQQVDATTLKVDSDKATIVYEFTDSALKLPHSALAMTASSTAILDTSRRERKCPGCARRMAKIP